MADGMSITSPYQEIQEKYRGETPPNIYNMEVNYAVSNKWFAFLPLENILGGKYANLNLHLTRFSLPQMQMQSQTVSYRGDTIKLPTKVFNPDDKTLTLEYLVDENWQNYRSLFAWMCGITGTINKATNDEKTGISPSEYLPLRVYLLDNYKRKIIQFVFNDCWIETFGDIALEQNSSDIVKHSFSFCYKNYEIEDIE